MVSIFSATDSVLGEMKGSRREREKGARREGNNRRRKLESGGEPMGEKSKKKRQERHIKLCTRHWEVWESSLFQQAHPNKPRPRL